MKNFGQLGTRSPDFIFALADAIAKNDTEAVFSCVPKKGVLLGTNGRYDVHYKQDNPYGVPATRCYVGGDSFYVDKGVYFGMGVFPQPLEPYTTYLPYMEKIMTQLGVTETQEGRNDIITADGYKIASMGAYEMGTKSVVTFLISLNPDFDVADDVIGITKRGHKKIRERATTVKDVTGNVAPMQDVHNLMVDSVGAEEEVKNIPRHIKDTADHLVSTFYMDDDWVRYGRSYKEEG